MTADIKQWQYIDLSTRWGLVVALCCQLRLSLKNTTKCQLPPSNPAPKNPEQSPKSASPQKNIENLNLKQTTLVLSVVMVGDNTEVLPSFWCCLVHCTTQPGAKRGFGHWLQLMGCTWLPLTYVWVFQMCSGTLRISRSVWKLSRSSEVIPELNVVQREGSVEVKYKARSLEWQGFSGSPEQRGLWGIKMGLSSQWQKSKLIFEHEDIIQTESLIYESMGIALVGENGGVIDARSGINKVWVEHNQGKMYMNSEHMVAGSEVNKRWDVTITYVQGQELTNTEFKHGNVVPGISEIIWGWWKGYWNLE